MIYRSNDEIRDMENIKENIIKKYLDSMKVAFRENFIVDNSLKENISVIDLFHSDELQIASFGIRKKITEMLNSFLYSHPRTMEEARILIDKRAQFGLDDRFMLA